MATQLAKEKVYIETLVEYLGRDEDNNALFRTDHEDCDDRAFINFALFRQKWRRLRTKTFDGYVGATTGKCRCDRIYRMRIPKHLVIAARLGTQCAEDE